MESIAEQLQLLRDDIVAIQKKCETSYEEVRKELRHKEIALKKLYEHNLKLVKEKRNCENK